MRIFAFLALASVSLPGCITAYEPTTGAPAAVPTAVARVQPAPARPAPAVPLVRQHLPPGEAPATPAGRQLAWVVQMLGSGEMQDVESRFAASFLAKVPATRLERVVHEWRRDELGAGPVELVQVEETSAESLIAFVKGVSGRHSQVRLAVDEQGLISGLVFAPAIGFRPGLVETWARFDDQLSALPGRKAFGAYEVSAWGGGTSDRPSFAPVHTFNDREPLSIGSTFKLYVLGALAERILEGQGSWDEEIEILDDLKSLPSGQMQLEQEGVAYPARRFAELMISISDNTATDHLMRRIGRERVEQYMSGLHSEPGHNLPMLTTMEFFRIKLSPDRNTLAEQFAKADERGRRAMLEPDGAVSRGTPSLTAAAIWRAPFEIERIGWFASSWDLARVMVDLHRLCQKEGMEPLQRTLRLNPGLAFDPRSWRSLAYKGGSEPGVLNMTWLLERHDGRLFVLTVTWNDPSRPVDTRRLTEIVGAAAGLLADEGLR